MKQLQLRWERAWQVGLGARERLPAMFARPVRHTLLIVLAAFAALTSKQPALQ